MQEKQIFMSLAATATAIYISTSLKLLQMTRTMDGRSRRAVLLPRLMPCVPRCCNTEKSITVICTARLEHGLHKCSLGPHVLKNTHMHVRRRPEPLEEERMVGSLHMVSR